MILSVFAPLGTAAAETDAGDGLEIDVTQDDELVTVTVTDDGEPLENATVNATVDYDTEWETIDDTDADGEVTFDAPTASDVPNESVDVTFEATHDNDSVAETVSIQVIDDEPADDLALDVTQDDGVLVTVTDNDTAVENATVEVATVDENATYAGTGEYATDENGTVALEAPNESVDVTVTATVGETTVEETVTLEPLEDDEPANFGQLLNEFKEENLSDDEPRGLQIASFVVEHNPGNAPDHAGPPAHAGPPGDDDDETEQGPPDHAGGSSDDGDDDEQGPPAHAGPPSDADEADEDEEIEDENDGDDGESEATQTEE